MKKIALALAFVLAFGAFAFAADKILYVATPTSGSVAFTAGNYYWNSVVIDSIVNTPCYVSIYSGTTLLRYIYLPDFPTTAIEMFGIAVSNPSVDVTTNTVTLYGKFQPKW